MNIKLENVNGKIRVQSPYNDHFIKEVKQIGGKWNGSNGTWDVPEDNKDLLDRVLLDAYGYSETGTEMIKVQYLAEKFIYYNEIRIGNLMTVNRIGRDYDVTFHADTVVIEGNIPGSGGSVKNPRVAPASDTILQSIIPQAIYDSLEDKEKDLITIIEEKSREERLQEEKARLLERIKEINLELGCL